jgi:hypothetical protein
MAKAQEPAREAAPAGRYDASARRRSVRRGRERGCHIYIAMEELQRAGWSPDDPPPFYRVWGSSRGGVFVRLYEEA